MTGAVMPTRPTIFVTRRLPDAVTERLLRSYEARLNPEDRILTPQEIAAGSAGADALIVTPADKITAELINSLPASVRAIATFSVGYEHIALDAAKARGIVVTN